MIIKETLFNAETGEKVTTTYFHQVDFFEKLMMFIYPISIVELRSDLLRLNHNDTDIVKYQNNNYKSEIELVIGQEDF